MRPRFAAVLCSYQRKTTTPVSHEFDGPEAVPRSTASQRLKVFGALVLPRLLLAALRPDTVRAACRLAQSGMLTKNQRMTAVPDLLNYMDDTSLDPTTQKWVFQALEDITGASIGPDPAAWRTWWVNHNRN